MRSHRPYDRLLSPGSGRLVHDLRHDARAPGRRTLSCLLSRKGRPTAHPARVEVRSGDSLPEVGAQVLQPRVVQREHDAGALLRSSGLEKFHRGGNVGAGRESGVQSLASRELPGPIGGLLVADLQVTVDPRPVPQATLHRVPATPPTLTRAAVAL